MSGTNNNNSTSSNNNGNSNSNNNHSIHQHLHSPSKLTEFARNFEEKPESLFGRVVNKIQNVYNQSYNTVNDISSGSSSTTTNSGALQVGKSKFYAEKAAVNVEAGNDDIESDIPRTSSSSSLSTNRPQPPTTLQLRLNSDTQSISSNTTTNTTTTVEDSEANERIYELPSEANQNQGRTVSNVLKHISHIVASKNDNDMRNYKDTELQLLWMPDSKAKECYDCAQKFSTFRRKHHCRLCGQIFCSKCCNQVLPGSIIRCEGDLKVCNNYCAKIVLSTLKSSSSNMGEDLLALQQHLSSKLEEQGNAPTTLAAQKQRVQVSRKPSVGYQEERFSSQANYTVLSIDDRKNILQQSNSLITLHEEMQRELPVQNCGQQLIEFLNTNNKSANEVQAVAILSAMLAAGFLEPIVPDAEQTEFDATLHYRFAELSRIGAAVAEPRDTSNEHSNPISPQFDSSAEPQPPKSMNVSLSFQSAQELELENDMCLTTISTKLLESYCAHEEQLLAQLLHAHQLDNEWGKVLQGLCSTAANHFKPEYCSNDLMDIRNYVNFKKVPGGRRKDSKIVHGVAFSKNVAHKDMATHVASPRILLLQCPIVYERIEGKFVTIETVLLQEKEYLRNVCTRLMNFKPNVLLVHKNVAGIAQDILRSHDVTLVVDVKLSVMERLSRTLQCDIVSSIESTITTPKLGYCNNFYIRNYAGGKTLMFFEKLNSPRGYTCLLRGGNNAELTRAKRVASALLFARYNWRLEMSFLLDEFAQPLGPKPSLFDSKEPSPNTENATADEQSETEAQLRSSSITKRPLAERKSEDKFISAVSENVSDFTDPLRSSQAGAMNNPTGNLNVPALAVEMRYDNRFRNALSSTLLSVSPCLTFPLPYLETEQGRNCKLRKLFPAELYFSKQWSKTPAALERPESTDADAVLKTSLQPAKDKENEQQLLPAHDFVKMKITTAATSRDIQSLLAEFRSFGGRFPKGKAPMLRQKKKKIAEVTQRPQKVTDEQLYKDALDPQNHQRLPVLFCSFHYNPKGVSLFCKLPMLLDMKFYGQHDIMLEQFLQRYCCLFNSMCPSCNLPMLGHVRRYVHSLGCVHVYLTEDSTRSDPKRIYFTSWCSICNARTPAVPLSDAAKRLSLAKYLEMRFHGHAYKRRPPTEVGIAAGEQSTPCEHSLHRDYVHHFSFRGVGAKFQYIPVEVWETDLPSLTLQIEPPKSFNGVQVQEEIKSFSLRGHEVYTRIHERIADLATEEENSPLLASLKATLNKDQFTFKQKVEIVHTLLTERQVNSYDVGDAIIMTKRKLAGSIELWCRRLLEIEQLTLKQNKLPHQVDAGTICTEELRPEQPDAPNQELPKSKANQQQQVDSGGAPIECSSEDASDSEKTLTVDQMLASTVNVNADKKSIKSRLLTLRQSNNNQANALQSPIAAQDHLTLPMGSIPVLVRENDLSSVIAYGLTSAEYQRCISGESASAVANSSPQPKHKQLLDSDAEETSGTAAPESESERNKPSKSQPQPPTQHVSLTFGSSSSCLFQCTVYFAREFDALRAKCLSPPKLESKLRISLNRNGSEIELVSKTSDVAGQHDEQPNAEEESRIALARSLSSSMQWEARGGKSGSRFCKTLDDRFVLKEMNKKEMILFESFVPEYLEYIGKCKQQKDQPTLLAKIFGVFKVSVKNKDTFVEKTLLVMENLFYGCDISNKFDLKGSERNRLVDPNNTNGEIVLLDENLVQMSWSKPLYVLSHSKAVLRDAIQRDASFLERNEVMDYSLLVGLDYKRNVLVLGIIDYIRTFTLDKKLESMIKQTGILGGGIGKSPTVLAPQPYKQRFVEAMDRYFSMVPDRWEGLSKI
ncbi:putative 1-phosphatidylinositol 3-phosphate 5-kinase [Drosophila grimshawi]|uniref:1-phosphatidylinositol-3-phosphate 5-kinase n=1 Tax=Drosophila grimshawi TaxID=7222 RepID=B4J9J7_DROGR|nr:putative 1-phosphatidylinositol 3-phosphate 5-kinase [Drosophila grimshawi]EDW02504.1 GH19848 [Drosophila grimshawi]